MMTSVEGLTWVRKHRTRAAAVEGGVGVGKICLSPLHSKPKVEEGFSLRHKLLEFLFEGSFKVSGGLPDCALICVWGRGVAGIYNKIFSGQLLLEMKCWMNGKNFIGPF